MSELKSLTLNGKTYDSFVDKEARESIKNLSPGGSGTPGEDGGYYTPKVEQTDANTMKVSYTASKGSMPAVAEQSITLPAGPKGDKYELTDADKQEIAEQAAQLVEVPEGGNTVALSGKRLSVLGDSISTYTGYIPDGYETFYTAENLASVNDTWWKKVCDRMGIQLLVNNSYSGSCVAKRSGVTIPSGSETARNMALDDGENAPDIIIVELGTNDFLVSVSVGSYAVSSKETFDAYSFKGAYAKMLWNILSRYPNSKVYCATIMPLIQNEDNGLFPTSHSAGGIEAYNNAIKEIAEMFGVQILDFNKCGITAANLENTTVDGRIHPNADGHTLMANYAVKELAKFTPVLAAYINEDAAQDSTGGGDSGGGEDSGGDTDSGTLLHSFDFTTGEIADSVGGLAVTATNVTADENGALFVKNSSLVFTNEKTIPATNRTFVYEFGDMDGSSLEANVNGDKNHKVIVIGDNTFYASGIAWNATDNQWTWAHGLDQKFAFDGNINDLKNGVLKIVFDSSRNASIYFNDELKYEYPTLVAENVYVSIGGNWSMTVKKFEIYSNE